MIQKDRIMDRIKDKTIRDDTVNRTIDRTTEVKENGNVN